MMTLEIIATWLLFANCLGLVLVTLAILRIQDSPLKYSFAAVILSGLIYTNPLLAFWLPGLDIQVRLILSRIVFTGVLTLANAFVAFIVIFCRLQSEFKSLRFVAFQASILGLIALVWAGFLPEGIYVRESGEFALNQGFAQRLFVGASVLYATYMAFLAWLGYTRTQEEVLQFQIRYLIGGGVVLAFVLTISNAILPYLTQRSFFAPVAMLELTLYWCGALVILVQGPVLLLRQDFRRLLRDPALRHQETLYGLRSLLYAFGTVLKSGKPVDETIRFTVPPDRRLALRLAAAGESQPAISESVPLGWYEGQMDELQRIRAENFRLSIAVEQGRQLLQNQSATSAPANEEMRAIEGTVMSEESGGLSPLEIAEKATILNYLQKNRFNQARTSRELQIRPNTLIIKMRKFGITRPTRSRSRKQQSD
ncbi:MAG: hypothetical protein JNM27_10690 [Leptospirales bacterium]|nr:hypothetical protein [Leptospirales bacterium]